MQVGAFYGAAVGQSDGSSFYCDVEYNGTCGGLYRVTLRGDYQILRIFKSGLVDPIWPMGGFSLTSDGRLYSGSHVGGGSFSNGAVFSIAPESL